MIALLELLLQHKRADAPSSRCLSCSYIAPVLLNCNCKYTTMDKAFPLCMRPSIGVLHVRIRQIVIPRSPALTVLTVVLHLGMTDPPLPRSDRDLQ